MMKPKDHLAFALGQLVNRLGGSCRAAARIAGATYVVTLSRHGVEGFNIYAARVYDGLITSQFFYLEGSGERWIEWSPDHRPIYLNLSPCGRDFLAEAILGNHGWVAEAREDDSHAPQDVRRGGTQALKEAN